MNVSPNTSAKAAPPPFDLSEIFHSDDLKHFEGSRSVAETRVYNWYAHYGASIRPKEILEIGVRRGYSAFALIKGAEGTVRRFLGVDMELDIPGSNADAEAVVRRLGVDDVAIIKSDTRTSFPWIDGSFDLIHVDADHSMRGALKDICNVLPLLSPGGTIIVDDVESAPVKSAIELVEAALAERATFSQGGDFHLQTLIRMSESVRPELSFDQAVAMAEPRLKAVLLLESAVGELRAMDPRCASEEGIARSFGRIAQSIAVRLDLAGLDVWREDDACRTADQVLAAFADLIQGFSNEARTRHIEKRPWVEEANEHGRYAVARLAGVTAPPLLAGEPCLPDAFQRGTGGFNAMLREAACNFSAICERATHIVSA